MNQKLAAVKFEKGDDVDSLLLGVRNALTARGLRVGGVVQVTCSSRASGCPEDVRVMDLATEDTYSIWDYRGASASGCRLDEAGLAITDEIFASAIAACVDLLIINRFGRAEHHGRGTLAVIGDAITTGIPVLTAVRPPYIDAWERFHGGYGLSLPAQQSAVISWFYEISSRQARANDAAIAI